MFDQFRAWMASKISPPGGLVRVGTSEVVNPQNARGIERTMRGYAKEGYGLNVIAYRCVEINAKSLSQIPLKVRRRQTAGNVDVPATHPLQRLLDRPNPTMTGRRLVRELATYHLIAGNSFLEKLTNGAGEIKELWPWSPVDIKVAEAPRAQPWPMAWVFDGLGRTADRRVWEVDQITGACDLLQWRTPNPNDRWFGMSPLAAAALSVDQHNAAGQWNANVLSNSASPAGIFTYTGSVPLTPEQYNQLRKQIREEYQGAKNAKTPFVSGGQLEYTKLSMTQEEMDWLEGKNMSAREVAAAYGTPTQVIPIQGDQTFANYEQARLALWEDTVIPAAWELCELLAMFLDPTGKFTIEPDLDGIPALAARRAETWNTVSTAGFLSTNEKREAVGYDPLDHPEADAVFVDAGKLPLGFEDDLPVASAPEDEDPDLVDDEEEEEEDPEREDEEEPAKRRVRFRLRGSKLGKSAMDKILGLMDNGT